MVFWFLFFVYCTSIGLALCPPPPPYHIVPYKVAILFAERWTWPSSSYHLDLLTSLVLAKADNVVWAVEQMLKPVGSEHQVPRGQPDLNSFSCFSYCNECMLDPDCGFCYKINGSAVIDSSCVPVNKASTTEAAWGRYVTACQEKVTRFQNEARYFNLLNTHWIRSGICDVSLNICDTDWLH